MGATPPIRLAISGAAGRVSYSLLFRIANGGLFGHDQPVALSLLDLPEKIDQLQAWEQELRDCSFPLLAGIRITSEPVRAFEGADWIVLLAGKEYRPQPHSRPSLLRDNAPIMIDQGRAINRAAPRARILVASVPCNTNTMIAMSHAPDVPRENWFALNQGLRSRATVLLAEKASVPLTRVTHLTVWGNTSEKAFVDLGNTRIDGRPALEVIKDMDWCRDVFQPALVQRYREAYELGGETPAGSIAQGILSTIRAITTPTPFEHWFGAGVVSDGSYDVPRGLVFGFPLLTSDGKHWTIAQGQSLDPFARDRIAENVAELELEVSSISHLLGPM
jgi:malate dehydrogenase